MATSWYKNYLAADVQPWARQVQKEVDNLKSNFQSAEVNNTTRDDQLASSLRQVQGAANDATQAAADAADAAQDALDAINGLTSLGSTGSLYNINADNITAGTIDAIDIFGSTITGGTINGTQIIGSTLTTATSGQRVTLNSNNITFNNGSTNTGSIYGSTFSGNSATYIDGNACVINSTQGNYFVGQTGVFSGSFSSENDIVAVTGSITRNVLIGGGTTGASITNGGNFVRTSSSQRYKTDIELLDIDLNDLYALQPKTFKRIDEVEEDGENARVYPGLIAEELAGTSLDKFVFYSEDGDGNPQPEGIHYPELAAALLLAVQDLNTRLQALEG